MGGSLDLKGTGWGFRGPLGDVPFPGTKPGGGPVVMMRGLLGTPFL